jgi:hypothetical protein
MTTDLHHVPTNGDAPHVAHRRAFRDFVVAEAEGWMRPHLLRLFDLWQRWNEEYYDGVLEPPYILLDEPSTPQRYGDCSPVSGFGGRSEIRIRPSLLTGTHPHMRGPAAGRFRFVADVLLHEQIHQYHQEVTGSGDDGYHGHGPAFRDTANQIGARLGLPRVRTCKRRGPDRDLPSCSQWPHDVRPDGFYLGAYVLPKRSRLAGTLVVTLEGDPEAVADRLIGALKQASPEIESAVTDAILDSYAPEEWHEWLDQRISEGA